jgi:hypothetical protein
MAEEHPLVMDGHAERRPFEEEGIAGSADATADDAVEATAADQAAAVWLAQPAEDLRRAHALVIVARGNTTEAYELEGWREERPIARLLAIAGYGPKPGGSTQARTIDLAEQPVVPVQGFKVPAGRVGAVVQRLRQAMRGELGGLSSLAHGQLGFHQAHTAFRAAWEAAGRPPMQLQPPPWIEPGAGSGAPLPLNRALESDPAHVASRGYWDGADLGADDAEGGAP